ncbi:MAG: DUF3090 family protein [Chloroflexi bacterium]|nr:DUF3090 family protein [Chloroflexota bacterium]
MARGDQELGMASRLQAEAIGAPGQRRFRLVVEAEGGSALLWVEKEQLLELAIAIKRVLVAAPQAASPPVAPRPSGRNTSRELTVSSLSLYHDSKRNLFCLRAEEASETEERPRLRFWAGEQLLAGVSEEALRVVAAGRPRCPLCGALTEPDPHVCARGNGHFNIAREEGLK